jgi:hypothetical protein
LASQPSVHHRDGVGTAFGFGLGFNRWTARSEKRIRSDKPLISVHNPPRLLGTDLIKAQDPTMSYKTSAPAPARRSGKMATALKSFFGTAKNSATPIDQLFPKVDPAIDGEDCDHDCETCVVQLPAKFKIDEDDQLYGQIKGWSQHILVATGKTDWVRDVADEKGSVMEAIEKKADVKPSSGVLNHPQKSGGIRC